MNFCPGLIMLFWKNEMTNVSMIGMNLITAKRSIIGIRIAMQNPKSTLSCLFIFNSLLRCAISPPVKIQGCCNSSSNPQSPQTTESLFGILVELLICIVEYLSEPVHGLLDSLRIIKKRRICKDVRKSLTDSDHSGIVCAVNRN